MSTSNPNHSLDGQSNSEVMIGLSAGLGLLCLSVVSARLYTRGILLRNAGLDDLFIFFTQVSEFLVFPWREYQVVANPSLRQDRRYRPEYCYHIRSVYLFLLSTERRPPD